MRIWRSDPKLLFHLAIAGGVVLAATALRYLLDPVLGRGAPFLLYFPAIMFAGWLGGLVPGLLATLLGALAGQFAFVEPRLSLAFTDTPETVRFVLFVAEGLVISVLCERMHRSELAVRASESRLREALAALGEREERLRRLFELPLVGLTIGDSAGAISDANEAFLAMVGYSREDLAAGRLGLLALTPPEYLPLDRDAWRQCLEAGRCEPYEKEYLRRDGSRVPVVQSAALLPGSSETFVSYVLDRSARHKVERERRRLEERLRIAVEGAGMGNWDADLATGDLVWSETHFRMLGYDPRPDGLASTEMWRSRVHPDDLARVEREVERARTEGSLFASEYRVIRADDGRVVWLSAFGRFRYDAEGRPVRFGGVFFDATERRTAENERLRLLESERAARTELERASRLKDEFLATLSHELRTPLNAILGWAHVLRMRHGMDKPDGGRDPRMEEGLAVVERNARAQAQLIEDLLDMNRIASGQIRLDVQPVDLAVVVEAAIESVRHGAEAKEVGLDLRLHPGARLVRGDPGRLQQVAWNLLSNAIKFTPRGGWVRVSIAGAGDAVRIAVADSGQGIPRDFLPHVFERFRQADASTTRRHGGLGLGLAIVKHLVELHGGQVSAASEGEGRGATFVVELPAARISFGEDEAASPERGVWNEGRAAESLDGVDVLVVDDERDSLELVRRVLEGCRARVRSAASAEEALAAIARKAPDVLVSDIGMPGKDGYELIRELRAMGGERGGVPAVALTALARAEDRTLALEAGYETHLPKPVEPAELVATVARLAAERRPA